MTLIYQKLLNCVGGEGTRYHFLSCSVFDSAWLNTVSIHHQRPFLFLAEGVLMYLKKHRSSRYS
jgi:O-methyltransferase involved in polyketide biosynthesis